jgi:hypothetical protein
MTVNGIWLAGRHKSMKNKYIETMEQNMTTKGKKGYCEGTN